MLLLRIVALARLPRPIINAVRIALLPLPFWPINKFARRLKSTDKFSWHMKFFNLTPKIWPLRMGVCCTKPLLGPGDDFRMLSKIPKFSMHREWNEFFLFKETNENWKINNLTYHRIILSIWINAAVRINSSFSFCLWCIVGNTRLSFICFTHLWFINFLLSQPVRSTIRLNLVWREIS